MGTYEKRRILGKQRAFKCFVLMFLINLVTVKDTVTFEIKWFICL